MPQYERRAYGLKIQQNGHPDIKRIRKLSGVPHIHGNKVWKSSLLLMDYLKEYPPEITRNRKKLKVLEIGCGWGLTGIYCAKKFNAKVTGLDADDTVFPYLEHHAAINDVSVTTWKCRYEKVRSEDLEKFDLVIGADICFWDEMVKPLYNLVRRASKVDGLRVVLADPGRPTFTEMAEKAQSKLGAYLDAWSVPHPHNASGWIMDLYLE
ncbi:putative nicotinamide N-methyase [Alteromonadaceae bacterium 2753L.S.0a.02]|nr:putative nicotinamide N-methyase [Alteromonadaceae bacterium 2753L.S.0a.02]